MTAIKDMFRDALQQVLESELEYEKSQRIENDVVETSTRNYRNDYSKKTVKTQLGEVEINIPRDCNGKFEPHIIGKYNRNSAGMEEAAPRNSISVCISGCHSL